MLPSDALHQLYMAVDIGGKGAWPTPAGAAIPVSAHACPHTLPCLCLIPQVAIDPQRFVGIDSVPAAVR